MLAGIRPTLQPTNASRRVAVRHPRQPHIQPRSPPGDRSPGSIVGGLLGPAGARSYRVASSLADSRPETRRSARQGLYPEVVRMDLATKNPWKLMLRGTVLATAFGLVAVLLLLVGGRQLVRGIFGTEFLPAYPVLMVLILVPLLAMISFPLPSMLYALDRPDAPLKARWSERSPILRSWSP